MKYSLMGNFEHVGYIRSANSKRFNPEYGIILIFELILEVYILVDFNLFYDEKAFFLFHVPKWFIFSYLVSCELKTCN